MKFVHRINIHDVTDTVEIEATTLPEWQDKFVSKLGRLPRKAKEKIINRFRGKVIDELLGEERRDSSLRLFSDL